MLAQPAKKATPLAAKMRISLELVIFVFMVLCIDRLRLVSRERLNCWSQ
jgi:hypothetical protein